uniref:NADH-ubiquinone oxidoreductase chain 2 n=1 Tax=Cyamophila willieti TaxID=2604842 RepID=A0A8F2E648_9HEMI|nr:NADH dehydrogenase subunit 2 [Cyamophila willieti]
MKNYYLIIMPLYLLSIMFSLSSNCWMSIWIGMEMNLLTFIFIILEKKTFNSNESCMKYFLIQSVGSLIFLFSVGISVQMTYVYETFSINALVPPLALMLKSGIAPLHMWTPDVSMKLSPLSLFLFISLQKLIPMFIMFSSWTILMKWVIPVNMVIGSMGGITQASINKMLIFSSINNSGWMMLSLTESTFLFILFFIIYFLMNCILLTFIWIEKIKWISQIKSQNFPNKILITSVMMSLSGLPPFMGFIPKWIILKKIILFLPLVSLISIIMSIFTMFFYLKITINMLLYSSLIKKWTMIFSKAPMSLFFLLNLTSSLLFIFLT